MRGDFSRLTFDPARHYSGVRQQQGRVQLDADWNEQADIQAYRDETATADAIGWCGGPAHSAGFGITAEGGNLRVAAGSYYVNGILCQNERDVTVSAAAPITGVPVQPDLPDGDLPTSAGAYLAYLDVWQRHITALEDASIREVALDGPDTTSRLKTVWQVKWEQIGDIGGEEPPPTCAQFGEPWTPAGAAPTGTLRARAQPGAISDDPCVVPPGAGFRRIENQLYRVELHRGGDTGAVAGSDRPTYKWSRDNGSIVTRLVDIAGDDVTVADAGRDAVLGFAPGQWIELSDERRELLGEPGTLVEIAAVNGPALTVKWPPAGRVTMADFGTRPTVRRWDSAGSPSVRTGVFVDLEDGVQVEFTAGTYRSGDYWTIPARTLIGDVEWPANGGAPPQPRFSAPHGVAHHYCPLAMVTHDGAALTVAGDCRRIFHPLTEHSALHYVSGDGQEVMPDLTQPASALVRLARPLQVGVANRGGASVRFRIVEGLGSLTGGGASGTAIIVPTDSDGVAGCDWDLDSATLVQRVEAHLLDDAGRELPLPVRFNATLSIASHVAYTPPADCLGLRGRTNVQAAIDRLADLPTMAYAGGDGQDAPLNDPALRQLLRVSVSSSCGPVAGATIRFIAQGNGRVAPDVASLPTATRNTLNVHTDPNGIAACAWRLEPNAAAQSQELEAVLLVHPGEPAVAPVRFNASLSVASRVSYAVPATCTSLAGADTVQKALDLLCQQREDRGIRISAVRVGKSPTLVPLNNDTDVAVNLLTQGITIFTVGATGPIVEASVRGKPTCRVSVELPYPFNASDMELWRELGAQPPVVGFQTITLAGDAVVQGANIVWTPALPTTRWLDTVFGQMDRLERGDHLLAHLRLDGNFIWSGVEPRVYLDGDAFGLPGLGGTTALDLKAGSGDGHRGGTFEMWFRLVARAVTPSVVTEPLRPGTVERPVRPRPRPGRPRRKSTGPEETSGPGRL